MLDIIWLALFAGGLGVMIASGRPEAATQAIFGEAGRALQSTLALVGTVSVWFGISRVAEKTGLIDGLARWVSPLLRPLFPSVPSGHPAISSIAMNIAANILGLGNAATPFGLQAMRELQELNPTPGTLTPAMVTFLVLNSTTLSILPTGAIALRTISGSASPADIVFPAALASAVAMVVALVADAAVRRRQA
ncbi:MAG: nucleoside recognition domain-containing protein [Chloroflexota bacterium]